MGFAACHICRLMPWHFNPASPLTLHCSFLSSKQFWRFYWARGGAILEVVLRLFRQLTKSWGVPQIVTFGSQRSTASVYSSVTALTRAPPSSPSFSVVFLYHRCRCHSRLPRLFSERRRLRGLLSPLPSPFLSLFFLLAIVADHCHHHHLKALSHLLAPHPVSSFPSFSAASTIIFSFERRSGRRPPTTNLILLPHRFSLLVGLNDASLFSSEPPQPSTSSIAHEQATSPVFSFLPPLARHRRCDQIAAFLLFDVTAALSRYWQQPHRQGPRQTPFPELLPLAAVIWSWAGSLKGEN